MSSEDVIGISRDFFEAVLTPSNTYFWVTIVFGLGFMVLGFRFSGDYRHIGKIFCRLSWEKDTSRISHLGRL